MRLTVGQRLILPFFFIVMLMATIGGLSIYNLDQLNANTEEILQEHQPVLTNIAAIESGVLFHSLKVGQYVVTGNRAHLRTLEALRSQVETNLVDLESRVQSTEDQQLAQEIREAYDTYISLSDGLRTFYQDHPDDKASVEGRQMRIAAVLENALLAKADLLYKVKQSRAQELIQTNSELYRTYFRVTIVASVILIGLAIALSVLVSRSIIIPVGRLVEATQRIASGDLAARAQIKTRDEIGLLARDFNSMAAQLQEMIGTLEQRVAERTRNLLATIEVSRATTSVLDPDELLQQVVDLALERFSLYYVGLFLLDEERRFAVLRAGTGEAGQKMLAQGHRLEVGGSSMIGQCTARAAARIALDVGEEAVRFDNPLLPETRSEMALPLRSRGWVIGAMTVQSTKEAAFDETNVAVMQAMADQVAVAIDNARLFAETQAALRDMETTHQRYLGQAWAEYARARAISGYVQTGAETVPLGDRVLPEVQQVMTEQRPVVLSDDGDKSSALLVPVVLRDQPMGALGFKAEEGQQWSSDEIALAEAVAEQLALAVENLRLLEETQRRATRERLIGEVTARMRASLDLETVLRTAVREIGQAMGLAALEVRLGTEIAPAGPQSSGEGAGEGYE